ncbi:glycoside hydrolase family 28 protein (plasmid) [Streptomyces sp. NBC_00184]|uniref:glycoside hydrolase family 28 protein n=1 Tax=Streptomyces sp. NBC_00184 TaxID=2975673 RepID=UPI002E2980BE|nr:glycoside hydrolase family 28 protein [Streptomyces sp. NBC_00184]
MNTPDRRTFLTAAGLAAAGIAAGTASAAHAEGSTVPGAQRRAARILARIHDPRFPERRVSIADHGAVGDGVHDCTDAVRDAIETCARAGGGHVVVPPGEWLTGAIHLRDRIDLHVEEGATLRFRQEPEAYLPAVYTRYEGVECFNYSPLVYAFECRTVAVTGRGTLDGQADWTHWWDWTKGVDGGPSPQNPDIKQLLAMGDAGTPVPERVFGAGHFLRPNMIQFYRCQNVLVEGVTVSNSPMWNIHPVLSTNVTVRGVTVDSPVGPNNDGVDPESCSYVLIQDCLFDTGDDCIAFKAGKNADGRRVGVPMEHALVERCEMRDGHGGVTLGSENSGGISDIVARHCVMDSPRLDRAIRLKSNPLRGGYLRDVLCHDITVGEVGDAVVEIALDYERVESGDFYPDVRRIEIHRVTTTAGPRAWTFIGNDANPIHDVLLSDCAFNGMTGPNEQRNIEGLVLRDVTINGQEASR